MRIPIPVRFAQRLRMLNLWPRLAIALTVGFLLLFGIISALSLGAVTDSTGRVLRERMVITQMAATELDRLIERAFYELEKATELASFDPQAPSQSEEAHVLAHTYGRAGTFALGAYYLDPYGRVVLSEPGNKLPPGADLSTEEHIRKVQEIRRRVVSDPFLDQPTGRPAVALTIPVLDGQGVMVSMISGLIDVGSPAFAAPLLHARDLGHTGHAELVDHRGLSIAATDYDSFLRPGEHLEFYRRMMETTSTSVENVPYVPGHPVPEGREDERHIMAFAPLKEAPWGVGVGGSDWETLAPVTRLRNSMLLAGAMSLAMLWLLALVGARLLVRPVKILTGAARRMASGELEPSIHLSEGGEIGVLAESLEAMRVQLRDSMDHLRQWGEELEREVAARTKELVARNHQLAAISAVAIVGNEVRDLRGMLAKVLEVVLEHTGMEAGAVRLLDPQSSKLVLAAASGRFSDFPCRAWTVGLDQCPCGQVASARAPLILDPKDTGRLSPPCDGAKDDALVILPLESPKGVHGVLFLAREGKPPGRDEQETLKAICNQLAVAIENTRLLEELAQMEAQRELDRMKAEFVSAVSHEIRTPLGIVKGYASALSLANDSVEPSTRKEFLDAIEEETDKLQKMIDELLDTSRLQAGGFKVEPRPVRLKDLLETALHKASPLLRDSGHPLQMSKLEVNGEVNADPGRVEQVLYNLLDNAVRYSPQGTPIEIGAKEEKEYVSISVADRGDGVPAQELERIFEPFYRGTNARRSEVRGTGLGLSICRAIVEAQRGKLWVESRAGGGSIFVFTIPLVNRGVAGR